MKTIEQKVGRHRFSAGLCRSNLRQDSGLSDHQLPQLENEGPELDELFSSLLGNSGNGLRFV